MNLTINFTGFKEFEKVLKTLPDRVQNKVLQKSVTDSLRAVAVPALVAAAPVGTGRRSPSSRLYGPLSQNIKVERMRKSRSKTRKAARAWTTKAFWGHIYELGAIDKEFGTVRQPPRPWFQPAAIGASSAIFDDLRARVIDGVTTEYLK
jgi:hypothetical protein